MLRKIEALLNLVYESQFFPHLMMVNICITEASSSVPNLEQKFLKEPVIICAGGIEDIC